ncbi:hypothetical protein I3843_03G001700 [Carya illinoinensis]|uniref:RING-type domain-containing protein n=1 Tax=Carya illinoinensis TaxID=32201 RepID=A0A922D3J8_CARIL|nr:RING finger protein 10 isoform X1 [Carya illinoinensis]KAG6621766.1 hypothetical protein I3842_Q001700 [Carya illinoinensis]KAG7984991.1 hypothetical protein I3843_03G001700 [Carya illinoinensis]
MSILPNQTQGSTSSTSSSSLPLYPNSQQHGTTIRDLLQSPSPPSLSPQVESLQISDSQSPIAMLRYNSVSLASAEKDFGGSSKKVTDTGTPNDTKTLPHQSSDTDSQCHSGGRGVGSAQLMGKMSRTIISPRTERSMVSLNSHGSNMHSSGRKSQFMNGNHLLNFHYDPISRPQHQPRALPPRRQQKTKPYNKDLFLQANYKFVVLDSGNYTPESMDPDKMLRWEDIICVMYSTPFPVQCPICLEYPLCPQITSCGHIFCFPCILQYLLMGKEDHKGDSWKRCPLCFVMISPKDLYTIYIENVKQHCVGDTTEFVLLTRQKDSVSLLHKSKQETDIMLCHNHEICDPFSKFTFTSDVDLSVRKAISDLDGWLVRADSGLVDELEKLPYVCAAMEQLEQRKKYWNEHWAGESHRSNKITDFQAESHVLMSTACATRTDYDESSFRCGTLSTHVNDQIKWSGNSILGELNGGARLDNQTADQRELLEGQDACLSSSYGESQSCQRLSNETRDAKDKNSYNFYQAADGQHLILHPLNMRCLIHHYGSYDMLPPRISGRILQLETVTQSEAIRRRYRYLSHFSLTTTFQLCEIDLSEILSPDALHPFMDEIKKREKQRKQLARKDRREKSEAEAAAAAAYTLSLPVLSSFGQASHDELPAFSMDDFEALGSSPVTSSSPPIVGARRLFSNVTRLGFAAGHDSPGLKIQEPNSLPNSGVTTNSSVVNGSQNAGTPSFANVVSKAKSVETLDAPKLNELGKKGKKPSRVLMSTAGGRRY